MFCKVFITKFLCTWQNKILFEKYVNFLICSENNMKLSCFFGSNLCFFNTRRHLQICFVNKEKIKRLKIIFFFSWTLILVFKKN